MSAFSEMRAIFMRIIDRGIVIKDNVSPVQRARCHRNINDTMQSILPILGLDVI